MGELPSSNTVNPSRPVIEPWITDPDAAWWAKLRRANTHRETLNKLVQEFEACRPYTLTPEPGEEPNEMPYRLRIRREAPAEISTVIGDVLHNLRSALDSLAYKLAAQSKGQALTKQEERLTSFPWCQHPSEYDGLMRVSLYAPEAQKAMRVMQPFYWAEMANAPESERRQHSEEDFKWSGIYRLGQLSNIDKHRRLPALGVGWPSLFWWGSDEGDDTRLRGGHMPPTDNTILCYLVGANARNIELNTEFALVLKDDPMHQPEAGKPYEPQDCQKLLEGFADDVEVTVRQVLSRYSEELNR
jgi:hypothetical protein